jgi:hypothetical protein
MFSSGMVVMVLWLVLIKVNVGLEIWGRRGDVVCGAVVCEERDN